MPLIVVSGSEDRKAKLRRQIPKFLFGVLLSASLLSAGRAMAQVSADASPRFLLTTGERSDLVAIDIARSPILRKQLTLDLQGTSVKDALGAISRQSGLRLFYTDNLIANAPPKRLKAEGITVAAALTDVLSDLDVDVVFSRDGSATLVKRDRSIAINQTGTIAGRVTDSSSGEGIPGATVSVEAPRLSTTTKQDGSYVIRAVPAGRQLIRVRRLGYATTSQSVVVSDNSTVNADFAVARAPTRLNDVVTTAIGDQRRVEVGNVIAHINVDSIARTAPVTSVTDVLTARVSGLQVVETGGLTGGGEAIRIRGHSSLALAGDPIVIVDGVRQDNAPGGRFSYTFGSVVPGPSRLNDIDVSQIESIDILKGPTATTEYGTDAANGVIVITTVRARSGKPVWTATAEQGISRVPSEFPEYYYSWGHLSDGTTTPCPLTPLFGAPASTDGTCTVDSVTHFSPYNHKTYTIYGTGTRAKAGVSVGGGTDMLHYYMAAGLANETGMVRLPDIFRPQAAVLGMPGRALRPNDQDQHSIRANMQVKLTSTATIDVTGAYLRTNTNNPSAGGLTAGPISSPVLPDSAHNYGYGGYLPNTPLSQLGQLQSDRTTRATGGLSVDWHPYEWLKTRGTVGVDHGSTNAGSLFLPQAQIVAGNGENQGQIEEDKITTDIYSADARAAATHFLSDRLRTVTTIGIQFADTRTDGLIARAGALSPTNLTLNGVVNPSLIQLGNERATLGQYVEEQLAVAERLFLTGALRFDAGSGFGHSYTSAIYPKASVSWLALNGSATTLRFRAALGEAGIQPDNGAALQLYSPLVLWLGGGPTSSVISTTPGNPRLKPERSREFELGVDLGFWANRANLELTHYVKTTKDALVTQDLGWDFGFLASQQNLGEVENRGSEATLTVDLIQAATIAWDVTVNGGVNHNKLVHLAPGVSPQDVGYQQRNVPGYPLYGYWGTPVTFTDINNDHIIESNEVKLGDSAVFIGPSLPTREASLATHVGFMQRALTLGALFDYRSGFRVFNGDAWNAAYYGGLREQNDASAPLWLQARAVAVPMVSNRPPTSVFEDGTFLRFRELSLTYALPSWLLRLTRSRELTLTGAVRNLALWKKYTGPDPEVSLPGGQSALSQFVPGTPVASYDIRLNGFGAVPLARYWVVRLNAGL